MQTIVITFTNGTVETYSSCSNYTQDATTVSFTGKLSGQSDSKTWKINWATVTKLSIE